MDESTQKKLDELEKRIKALETKRITQQDILPDSIKMRAMGEGIRFIRGGVTADKPTTGEEPADSCAAFYDVTTNKLYIWNYSSNAWKSVTLS